MRIAFYMGYTIATSITVTKKQISIVGGSSNTFEAASRRNWGKRVDESSTHENTPENLRRLWHDLYDGWIRPTASANGYRWAYMLQTCTTFDEFLQFLNTKQQGGKYTIESHAPYVGYFVRRGACWMITPHKEHATPMSFYQSQVIAAKYGRANDLTVITL